AGILIPNPYSVIQIHNGVASGAAELCVAAARHSPRRRADHEGRVRRSIGRSPAGDRGKIERAPPPREPHLASAPRQTPLSRPLDLSGLSTVTADASLVASRYMRMKTAAD